MLKVILVDTDIENSSPLQASLINSGFDVIAHIEDAVDLQSTCGGLSPDIVVLNTDSPSKDMLDSVSTLCKDNPKPVVVFALDGDKSKIREATKAGVSAYVVGNIPDERLQAVIDAAIARFEETNTLKNNLNVANLKLEERKFVERAKGILMRQRDLEEDAAYSMLREIAMKRNMKLADLSKQLIDASQMLIV